MCAVAADLQPSSSVNRAGPPRMKDRHATSPGIGQAGFAVVAKSSLDSRAISLRQEPYRTSSAIVAAAKPTGSVNRGRKNINAPPTQPRPVQKNLARLKNNADNGSSGSSLTNIDAARAADGAPKFSKHEYRTEKQQRNHRRRQKQQGRGRIGARLPGATADEMSPLAKLKRENQILANQLAEMRTLLSLEQEAKAHWNSQAEGFVRMLNQTTHALKRVGYRNFPFREVIPRFLEEAEMGLFDTSEESDSSSSVNSELSAQSPLLPSEEMTMGFQSMENLSAIFDPVMDEIEEALRDVAAIRVQPAPHGQQPAEEAPQALPPPPAIEQPPHAVALPPPPAAVQFPVAHVACGGDDPFVADRGVNTEVEPATRVEVGTDPPPQTTEATTATDHACAAISGEVCELRAEFEDWMFARTALLPRDKTFMLALNGLVRQFLKEKKVNRPSKQLMNSLVAIAIGRVEPNGIEQMLAPYLNDPARRFHIEALNGALKAEMRVYDRRMVKHYCKQQMNGSFLRWQRVADIICWKRYSRKYKQLYREGHLEPGHKRFDDAMRLNTGN